MRLNERFTSPVVNNMRNGSAMGECRLAGWRDRVMAHWQVRFGRLDRIPPLTHLRRIPHRLLRDPGVQVTTPHGFVLHIPYGDWLVSQALQGLLYEQQTLSQVLNRIVTPGGFVVDGGPHVGLYTCLLGDRVGPEGRVIAFEPNPQIISWLRKNIASNSMKERVDVVEAALWKRSKVVMLITDYTSPCLNLGHSGREGRRIAAGLRPMAPVIGTALDDWLKQSHGHIPPIMLLKLDLEGVEQRALEGASGAIDSCRYIVIELNSGRSSRAERAQTDLLISASFDSFLVHEDSRSVTQYDQARCGAALEESGWTNILLERRH